MNGLDVWMLGWSFFREAFNIWFSGVNREFYLVVLSIAKTKQIYILQVFGVMNEWFK